MRFVTFTNTNGNQVHINLNHIVSIYEFSTSVTKIKTSSGDEINVQLHFSTVLQKVQAEAKLM